MHACTFGGVAAFGSSFAYLITYPAWTGCTYVLLSSRTFVRSSLHPNQYILLLPSHYISICGTQISPTVLTFLSYMTHIHIIHIGFPPQKSPTSRTLSQPHEPHNARHPTELSATARRFLSGGDGTKPWRAGGHTHRGVVPRLQTIEREKEARPSVSLRISGAEAGGGQDKGEEAKAGDAEEEKGNLLPRR